MAQIRKLKRSIDQYEGCSPDTISTGSQAQMQYFVADAKHDIAALTDALKNFTEGRNISYVEALHHARALLSQVRP